MQEKTLWEQFSLGEDNPDPGAGILYSLRYSLDRIIAHRDSVVSALQSKGVSLEENGREIYVAIGENLSPENTFILLEELSALNEAQEYREAGFNLRNLSELKNSFMTYYYYSLFMGNSMPRLPQAYDLVSAFIPQIVRDIQYADQQNHILSSSERKTLQELTEFCQRKEEQLNNAQGLVLFRM